MIEVKELTHLHGGTPALEGVSFKINNGKIYGILGGADAGKTTLLQLLAGVLTPTEGYVKINGFDTQKAPLRARSCIGFLPDPPSLCDELTPYEQLRFVADVRGLSELRAARSIHEALEWTDTDGVRDRLIKNLTESQRRRVGIAVTLIGNPEILLLDEPTAALPPREAEELLELLRALGESKTVLFTTRRPAELRALCAHVLALRDGKLIANAPLDEVEALDELVPAQPARTVRQEPERDGEYELIDTKEAAQ